MKIENGFWAVAIVLIIPMLAISQHSEAIELNFPIEAKNFTVVQQFGSPSAPQICGFETGIGIAARMGTPVKAAADGEVIYVGPIFYDSPGLGTGPYGIILKHDGDYHTMYGHNQAAYVSAGEAVLAGQHIADLGNLGYATGPVLYFRLLEGATYTNDFSNPFLDACEHYIDPQEFFSP